VKERLVEMKNLGLKLVLFTGNTKGNAGEIAAELALDFEITPDCLAKAEAARKYDLQKTATIGNGRIDLELFRVVELGILTLQAEGACTETLLESDIVVNSVLDALDLFLKPQRLMATLRN
jgi:soluble P-type ATPase